MNCNSKFRLGLLDGIAHRQRGLDCDVKKISRSKGPDYARGYAKGRALPASANKNAEKGNQK